MAVKFDTYVCVYFVDHKTGGTRAKFVTGTEGSSGVLWEDKKPAMKFAESYAKDIVHGLTCNGYAAAVIKVLHGLELSN